MLLDADGEAAMLPSCRSRRRGNDMNDESRAAGAGAAPQVGGPAAITMALRVLDRHVRVMVRHSIAQQAIRDSDHGVGVSALHDRLARRLHAISLEYGTEAMSTAAEYAAASLEAGSLYPGDELDAFLGEVARSVRSTNKGLTRSTPFGR